MKSAFVLFAIGLLVFAGCTWPTPPAGPGPEPQMMCVRPCHISLSDYDNAEFLPSCIESTEPIACTEEYRLGDACLSLISCKIENDSCTTTLQPEFTECISCFRDCMDISEDPADFMVCEEMCNLE
ncbi:MAG: hypothetical protein ABII71_05260 [Candidatus Micrarchaeota archaeon]